MGREFLGLTLNPYDAFIWIEQIRFKGYGLGNSFIQSTSYNEKFDPSNVSIPEDFLTGKVPGLPVSDVSYLLPIRLLARPKVYLFEFIKSVFKGYEKRIGTEISLKHSKMAQNRTCIGIKANGDVCGKQCRGYADRCGTHLNTITNYGPNTTAHKELKAVQRKQIRDIQNRYQRLFVDAEDDAVRRHLAEDELNELRILRATHHRELTMLVRRQTEEIRRTGIDPDAPARQRNQEREERRRAHWRDHLAILNQQAELANNELNRQLNNLNQRANRPLGELEHFARDAQNVHTTTAVQQTKDMVARILKINVPEEYKWNTSVCSKTPGEIIIACKLSPSAAWQMSAKYCQSEDVYEMGKGIYGKVLDGVWQYIINSSDKDDLCKILRQEMEDNIGMCAQGNLTRLCNILAGYMEGIGAQESPAEVLGRKLPKLMEIEDETTRLNEAYKLLVETGVPQTQWLSWVEALVDGNVQLRVNAGGEAIGLEVV
jgi:hypothetical protein